MDSEVYGFIPARGGSLGVRNKNLRPVGGKPLVVRAIETMLQVRELASVLLSTDSEAIALLGRQAGAEVPFLRPAAMATPDAPVFQAIKHAIQYLDAQDRHIEWLVMVQATSPFLKPETVAAVLAHARRHDLSVVQSVSAVKEHPYWVRVPAGLRMYPFHPTFGSLRRQDLPKLVVLNGAVTILRADVARAGELPPFPGFFPIDRLEGLDIDDECDLAIAQRLAASPAPSPADVVVESSHVSA